MNQCQLNLNGQERQYLADLLTSELKETQVEEHRTLFLALNPLGQLHFNSLDAYEFPHGEVWRG